MRDDLDITPDGCPLSAELTAAGLRLIRWLDESHHWFAASRRG
ncbi:hypothetical protein BJY16_005985 [Actinoplanes octamycinicus]|uniref:Uncharacterized protein n=1 Tax=Actinoplanes octamycinicus TaxID=135948 RepID=A0A7W7H1Z8_9ACTN|nr:hypothetical protein [Actinoplanes octamycinicus]MBB4742526.1 hypothetical protein [Actinoplanes octamycinicus]